MHKILFIIGTRPEAIKLAPLVLEIQNKKNIHSTICVTGQHRQMVDQVLNLFGITPEIDLNLMQQAQTLATLTANVITKVDGVLKENNPDIVIVQGDTTTVMASAMACFYNQIPVGHVEAGLRSNNMYSPFPEEMNRKVAGVLSSYHFAPTERAKKSLLRENVKEERVFVTGNTVIDAFQFIIAQNKSSKVKNILYRAGISEEKSKKLILVTAHRRENFGERFDNICLGLRDLITRNPNMVIVYPVHLNPEVQKPVNKILSEIERIILIDPVEYDVLAQLISASTLVLTDSGGIQEEAPSIGKPVLILRTETERPEGVEAGTTRLVGPSRNAIVQETEKLLHDPTEYNKMSRVINPYGDGKASKRIEDLIEKYVFLY